MEASGKNAVLLMGYGSPDGNADIGPFYTEIRGGHSPSPDAIRVLAARYARIGGRSPFTDTVLKLARDVESELAAQGTPIPVRVGMKHWRPGINATVARMGSEGITRSVGIVLAPHYSRTGTEGYFDQARESAARSGGVPKLDFVESWHDHPLLLQALARGAEEARRAMGTGGWNETVVLFTAHSLPERAVGPDDPYPRQLNETCAGVAALAGIDRWRFAFQSAGSTGERWLGPSMEEAVDAMGAEGLRRLVVVPVGFPIDNLETLYDIDILLAERTGRLGMEMKRAVAPNSGRELVEILVAIIKKRLAS